VPDRTERGTAVTNSNSPTLAKRRIYVNIRTLDLEAERTELEILELEETISKRRASINGLRKQQADLQAKYDATDGE
jgi:hypothetical protein